MSSGLQVREANLSGRPVYEVHAVVVLKDGVLDVYANRDFQKRFWFWNTVREAIGLTSELVFYDWPNEPMNLTTMVRQVYPTEGLGGPTLGFIVVYI